MLDSPPASPSTAFSKAAAVLLLLCLVGIVWHAQTQHMDLECAYRGEAPVDYVTLKLQPENFAKNWFTRIADHMDNSWAMRPYYYLAKYAGIPPEQSMSPMVLAQVALLAFALAHLAVSFYGDTIKALVFVVICFTAPATSLDLARFSYGITSNIGPLYYGWAFGFLFLGLSFHLRGQYFPAFLALTLGALCHITLGFIFCVFIGCFMLSRPAMMLRRDVLTGLAIFLPVLGFHIWGITQRSAIARKIPDDLWLATTKAFSFHWYPSPLGIFTHNAHRRFFPLLIIALLFLAIVHRLRPFSEKDRKLLFGMAACVVLGVVGYVTAEVFPSPFFIKLSPLRATSLLSLSLSLYLVGYLCDQLASGRILNTAAAAWMLAAMTLVRPGVPAIAVLLLLYAEASAMGPGRQAVKKHLLFFCLAAATACVVAINMLGDSANPQYKALGHSLQSFLWAPLTRFHPGGTIDMTLLGGRMDNGVSALWLVAAAVAIALAAWARSWPVRRARFCAGTAACAVALTIVWFDQTLPNQRWMNRNGEIAEAYLEAQLWARDNTPKQSLFMVEPYRGDGWRGYSQRSSFGNIHSWGYAAIGYRPDKDLYDEGQRRMAAFGIDWKSQFPDGTCERGMVSRHLKRQLRQRLYSMTEEELLNLAKKFDVDFIIMNKQFHQQPFMHIPTVHENSMLIVYATTPRS